jgi:hypothetical protein
MTDGESAIGVGLVERGPRRKEKVPRDAEEGVADPVVADLAPPFQLLDEPRAELARARGIELVE